MELVKQDEAARMSWCLADVVKLHGDFGLRSRGDAWADGDVVTVYPDVDANGNPVAVPPGATEVPTTPGGAAPVMPAWPNGAPPQLDLNGQPQLPPNPQIVPQGSNQPQPGSAPGQVSPASYQAPLTTNTSQPQRDPRVQPLPPPQ
jgi:hypothetical protein